MNGRNAIRRGFLLRSLTETTIGGAAGVTLAFLISAPAWGGSGNGDHRIYYAKTDAALVRRADLDGAQQQNVVHESARSIAVDVLNRYLYYARSNIPSVRRSMLDGSMIQEIIPEEAHAVAVDPLNDFLFWSNDMGIRRSDLIGDDRTTVVPGQEAQSLLVDPINGFLFWGTHNNTIMRSDFDGDDITTVITGFDAQELALDSGNNRIYFANGVDSVSRSDFDGDNIQHILSKAATAIAIDGINEYLFWAEIGLISGTINRGDLDGDDIVPPIIVAKVGSLALDVNDLVGACCLGVEGGCQCIVTDRISCSIEQGDFQGEGTTCELAPCGGIGDANGDGVVNILDQIILLSEWGPCAGNQGCLSDFNCDGVVNILDQIILLSNWTVDAP